MAGDGTFAAVAAVAAAADDDVVDADDARDAAVGANSGGRLLLP